MNAKLGGFLAAVMIVAPACLASNDLRLVDAVKRRDPKAVRACSASMRT